MLVDQQQCNWYDDSSSYKRSSYQQQPYQQQQQSGYSPRKIWNAPQNSQSGRNVSQSSTQSSQGQQIRIMPRSPNQLGQSPQQPIQKGQPTNLPMCYRCKTLGHFARDCPHPSETMLLFRETQKLMDLKNYQAAADCFHKTIFLHTQEDKSSEKLQTPELLKLADIDLELRKYFHKEARMPTPSAPKFPVMNTGSQVCDIQNNSYPDLMVFDNNQQQSSNEQDFISGV